uniref:Uncharacterized protein YjbI, contains pentapeptide repeats n=1 Tax=Candidatus Kentrum sp. TC TaxID=2126339 RepID=A0A450ZPN5_9GAMM|nr:MAG: Uncharacterized protein YjbI, contains pentapeptide repeats [Candidatus Kentron sp. TC]
MNATDYSHRRLRGRDFRGQRLEGARFIGADLRGARFQNAQLTGADFSGARLGKSLRGVIATVSLSLVIGLVAGLLDGFAGFSLAFIIENMLEFQGGELIGWTLVSAAGIVAILLFFLWRGGVFGLFPAMGVIIAIAVAVAVAVAVFFLPAFFIAWRIRGDDPLFAGLRQFGLWLGGLGGANFRNANLENARFPEANLGHARLAGASNLRRVDFRDARNLHLAYARDTLLEDPRARELLAGGDGEGRSYAGLNFAGAYLFDASLRGADLTEANLSDADLAQADLRDATLAKTQLIGADLTRARLTGACIAAWNIDKSVALQGIDCDHVFLESGDPPKLRQPPSGAFAPGEFTKLFQEVAETMDFIVGTRLELEALRRAIQTLREGGAEGLEVRGVERKEDTVVVRVATPPEIDRERIHAQALREKELEMRLLEAESKSRENEIKLLMQKERLDDRKEMEKNHRDHVKDLFSILRPVDIHVNAQGGDAVNKSYHQDIHGSGNVGVQGDVHGRISNIARNIGTLPAAGSGAETKLEELLDRLARELKQAPEEKAKDVAAVTRMVEMTVESAKEDNPALLSSAIEGLKKSARSLESYPAVLQIVSEVAKLLGG